VSKVIEAKEEMYP